MTKKVIVKNSVFKNNQNFVLFNLYDIPRASYYTTIVQTYLIFENITVLNNSAVLYDANSPYFSQFFIYSPSKPVNILFNNSYVSNNSNCIPTILEILLS